MDIYGDQPSPEKPDTMSDTYMNYTHFHRPELMSAQLPGQQNVLEDNQAAFGIPLEQLDTMERMKEYNNRAQTIGLVGQDSVPFIDGGNQGIVNDRKDIPPPYAPLIHA